MNSYETQAVVREIVTQHHREAARRRLAHQVVRRERPAPVVEGRQRSSHRGWLWRFAHLQHVHG